MLLLYLISLCMALGKELCSGSNRNNSALAHSISNPPATVNEIRIDMCPILIQEYGKECLPFLPVYTLEDMGLSYWWLFCSILYYLWNRVNWEAEMKMEKNKFSMM